MSVASSSIMQILLKIWISVYLYDLSGYAKIMKNIMREINIVVFQLHSNQISTMILIKI